MKTIIYIDNYDGLIEMYRYDRIPEHREACGKYSVIAEFMELLMPTIDQIKKGESLKITVEKDEQ